MNAVLYEAQESSNEYAGVYFKSFGYPLTPRGAILFWVAMQPTTIKHIGAFVFAQINVVKDIPPARQSVVVSGRRYVGESSPIAAGIDIRVSGN